MGSSSYGGYGGMGGYGGFGGGMYGSGMYGGGMYGSGMYGNQNGAMGFLDRMGQNVMQLCNMA